MATVTITISDEVKGELKTFSWVNWSEIGRAAFLAKLKKIEAMERLSELMKNSEINDEEAWSLSEQLKKGVYRKLGARVHAKK